MDKEYDVFGIGSPLIDIFIEADDNHLIELELKKGQMHLIDNVQFKDMQQKLENNNKNPIKTSIAGDIVNTMMGISSMGGRTIFCGKVGNGKYGDMFEEILTSDNIKPVLTRCEKYNTGRVISFVTKDAERTMSTYLGAAIGLKHQEAVFDDLIRCKYLYTSGYVFDSKDLKQSVIEALNVAKEHNVQVAFDLADIGVIKRNREEIKDIITNYVDILFANELEAEEFTGKKPYEALHELSKLCSIVIVKLGEEGSLIQKGDEKFEIKINKEMAIDSTGAGDMYASGFLFGLSRTDNISIAADIASYASSKIVQQYGAKLENSIKNKVEDILMGKYTVISTKIQ